VTERASDEPSWGMTRFIAVALATLLTLELPVSEFTSIPFRWLANDLGTAVGTPATTRAAWMALGAVTAVLTAELILRLTKLPHRLPTRVPGRILCGLGIAYAVAQWCVIEAARAAWRDSGLGAYLDAMLPYVEWSTYMPARALLLVGLARMFLSARTAPRK